jgi:threonyl-tRNA synthetase
MVEYEELLRYYTKLADSMEVGYVVAFRVVKDFYLANKAWFTKLLGIVKKPALFELLPEMKHYWIMKHEFQTIDSVGGNAQLSTVQLDVEDSERYGIFYTDADGSKKGCIILHSSVGSIERWIYALLENAEKTAKAKKAPMLPVWLSPTQVRVIPISSDQQKYAENILNGLREKDIRADLDDREQTVSSKVRDAETEWIPYIAVVGKAEETERSLSVRVRITREQRQMKLDELNSRLEREIGERPRLPMYLPERLSMRPKFV